MITTRREVIDAFIRSRSAPDDWKVRTIRYYLEKDGTFKLPRGVNVDQADYVDPDGLLNRLIRELIEADWDDAIIHMMLEGVSTAEDYQKVYDTLPDRFK